MKVLKAILVVLLILLVAVLCIVLAVKDRVIREVATKLIEENTGFGLQVERVHVGVLKPEFEIVALKMTNPEDFPEAEAFEINRVFARYELLSLLREEVHIYEMVLDVPKVVVVRKEDGETNMERLAQKGQEAKKRLEEKPGETPPEKPQTPPAPEKKPSSDKPQARSRFRIDTLLVKLGEGEIHKYKPDRPEPKIEKFPINSEQTYKDVTDPLIVVQKIAIEVIARQAAREINEWADKHEGDLQKIGLKKEDADKVGEALRGLFGK